MVKGMVRAGRWSVLPGKATYKKGQVGPGHHRKCRLECVVSGIGQSLELSDEQGSRSWVGDSWLLVLVKGPEVESKDSRFSEFSEFVVLA